VNHSANFQKKTGRRKMRKVISMMAMVVVVGLAVCFAMPAAAQDVKRMTIDELKGMLGNPDLVIIDARRDGDWKLSKVKIKGAVREDLENVPSWMNKYSKDKTLVFYCA
jgi:predicted sulfurtransferase